MGLALNFHKIVLLLCLAAAAAPAVSGDKLETFFRSYGSFANNDPTLLMIPGAQISNDALQVTPDSSNNGVVNPYNRSGRVLLNQPFKLWTDSSSNSSIASFNISFLINIYNRANDSAAAGDGLAFVIAPDVEIPSNSSGQYLGLTNSTTDGNATNHLVAVELDTFKDEFDPDANHVGLNINSVKSVKSASLTPHRIELAPEGDPPRFHVVWVQYKGAAKVMEVYVARQAKQDGPTPPRPDEPMLSAPLDLRQFVNQKSYFGFSASTGNNATQLNCVLKWNLTVEFYAEDKLPWVKIVIGAGVPILAVLVSAAAGLGYCLRKKRMAKSKSSIVGALKSLPGTPREFRFVDLKKATNNFEEKNKLGQGGFGVVYKGQLQKENLEVAVKWFSRESIKGQDDFLAELTIINLLRHKHLVRLLGWCHKNGKLLLVYEYMPNGSLDQHLFGGANSEPLSWVVRYKIISGVASALQYLHNEYNQGVLHRDVKASNIMLDSDFNARLGDFGLARALDNEKTSYAEAEGMPGTMGYIAPECILTGKATRQSDVYAFGAVLLEVVCGLRPGTKIGAFRVLVDWVWSLHREGRLLDAVDERLAEEDFVKEEAHRILLLGLACSHPIASERPTTHEIVQMISGSVPVPLVPPFKPAFVLPSAVPSGLEDISLDTTSAGTKSFSTTSQLASGWTRECVSREKHATSYSDGFDLV